MGADGMPSAGSIGLLAEVRDDALKDAKMSGHLTDLATLNLVLLGKTWVGLPVELHNVVVIRRVPDVARGALLQDLKKALKRDEAER
ncbi:MAG: hypothetical protein ABL971_11300 [Vicinamibacterales bacterium]